LPIFADASFYEEERTNSGDFKQGFQCSLSLSNTSDSFSDKVISHSIFESRNGRKSEVGIGSRKPEIEIESESIALGHAEVIGQIT
jgi:hypothetical protein